MPTALYFAVLLALTSIMQGGSVALRFAGIGGAIGLGLLGVLMSQRILRLAVYTLGIGLVFALVAASHLSDSMYNLGTVWLFLAAVALIFGTFHTWKARWLTPLANASLLGLAALDTASYVFRHTSIYSNPNLSGIISAALAVFWLGVRTAQKRPARIIGDVLLLPCALVSLRFSDARGSAVALLVGLAVYLLAGRKNRPLAPALAVSLTALIGIVNAAVIYLYTTFANSNTAIILNMKSRELFGKNAFSGREDRWATALEYIEKFPLLGSGNAYTFEDETGISFHNLFLHMGVQYGLVGMLAILAFFGVLLRRARYTVEVALILLMATCSIFEVFVFQNNIAVSLFIITLMAVARYVRTNAAEHA